MKTEGAAPLTEPAATANGPWLVGGNSRCGKTTLLKALNDTPGAVAGLPVEGLMIVFLNRWYLFPRRQVRRILEDYLSRKRFVDEHRSLAKAPEQFLATPMQELIATLPGDARHQIGFIAHALDVFAAERERSTWAVCDVNPETRFVSLRSRIPALRLALMVRDPRASLCHKIYWNAYPKRIRNADRMLRLELLRWGISLATGLHLRRRYPEAVHLLSFDALVSGDATAENEMRRLFATSPGAFRDSIGSYPLYSFDPERGWLTPDDNWEALLSEQEVALIETCVRRNFPDHSMAPAVVHPERYLTLLDRCYVRLFSLIVAVCPAWPEGVKIAVDTIFCPLATSLRRLRVLKTVVAENLRGLRGSPGQPSAG